MAKWTIGLPVKTDEEPKVSQVSSYTIGEGIDLPEEAMNRLPEASRSLFETLQPSAPTVGAMTGTALGTLGGPVGMGVGAVTGSMLGRAWNPKEYYEKLSTPQLVREELVNLLTAAAPMGGAAIRNWAKKLAPEALNGLRGLLLHSAGTGTTQAVIGQLANAVTGQKMSAKQAALEGGIAGAAEPFAKMVEVAAAPADISSKAYQAGKRLGIADDVSKAVWDAPDSPRAQMMRSMMGYGNTGSVRRAGDKLAEILERTIKTELPAPPAESAPGQMGIRDYWGAAGEVAGAEQFLQTGERAARATQAIEKEFPPSSVKVPEAQDIRVQASEMNAGQSVKAAKEIVEAIDDTLTLNAAGDSSPALNIMNNARQEAGERMGSTINKMSSIIGTDPLDMSFYKQAVDSAYAELKGVGQPKTTQVMNVVVAMKKELAKGKTFTPEEFVKKLQNVRKAYEMAVKRDPDAARYLLQIKEAGGQSLANSVQNSTAGMADPATVQAVLDEWIKVKDLYRAIAQMQEAFEHANTGMGLDPKKLREAGELRLPAFKTKAPEIQQSIHAFETSPEAQLPVKISAAAARPDLYNLLLQGDEAAWKYAASTPGVEDWALNEFVRSATKPAVSKTGEMVTNAESRKVLNTLIEQNPQFISRLSPQGKDALTRLQANPDFVISKGEADLGAIAQAATGATPETSLGQTLLSPAVATENVEKMKDLLGENVSKGLGRAIVQGETVAKGGGVDLNSLLQLTGGMREKAYIPGSPSLRRLEAVMSPGDIPTLADLGTVAQQVKEITKDWPPEAVERFNQVVRSALSTETFGSTAAGQLGAKGSAKTVAGVATSFGLFGIPRLVRRLSTENFSPKAMQNIAMLIRLYRDAVTRTGRALGAPSQEGNNGR